MPGRSELKLTERAVDALGACAGDVLYWDRALPGFGVRVYATGRKVYVVQSRGPGGPKRVTLGRHGEMSADEARKQAALVIDRIKLGEDPVPASPEGELTLSALAGRFMRVHAGVHCKPDTAEAYRSVLERHILPALGAMAVGEVGRAEVSALHHRLRDTPSLANTAVNLLSQIFSLAEVWELAPPGRNPCRGLRRYRTRPRERFLSDEEFQAPGPCAQARGGGGCDLAARNRGDQAFDADRMPEERGRGPSLGRRGPHGGGTQAQGRQDGPAHGPPDDIRPPCSGWNPPAGGQPLGDRGTKGEPPLEPPPLLGAHSGAGGAR